MKRNFQTVMPYIFSEEGGYADNPADPGGATNMGITISIHCPHGKDGRYRRRM